MPKAVRARPPAPSDDALEKIRIPFIRKARLVHAGREEDAFLIDLGMKGVFVERAEKLPVGAPVELRFHIPGNERPIAARCAVAWWHAGDEPLMSKSLPSGAGLAFVELLEDGRDRLRRFVMEYLGRAPRQRRFNRRPEAGEDT